MDYLKVLTDFLNFFRRNLTETAINSFQNANRHFGLMKDREFRQVIQFMLLASTIHEKFVKAIEKNPNVAELFKPCYNCKIQPNQVQAKIINYDDSQSTINEKSDKSKLIN